MTYVHLSQGSPVAGSYKHVNETLGFNKRIICLQKLSN
jgi:hypothetical protein